MRIFEFALVTEWESRLQVLAQTAEPERWNYLHVPSYRRLQILDNYVRHTFSRAFDQQKLVEGDGMLAFNTGLLTSGQEEIFAVFEIAEHYDPTRPIGDANKKWFLKHWARSGDRMLTDLVEFPALVEYWADPRDLVFDPKLEVQLNLDHIVRDNLSRFPEELGGRVDANNVPTDLTAEEGDFDADIPEEAPVESPIPLATRNALEGAMKNSIRLAQRSYRVAVPQFYRGKIQLLLPLYLRSSDRPDLALTLERHGGWYRAATVLYPDWAYSHARLLARPNSEWLGGFRTDVVEAELQTARPQSSRATPSGPRARQAAQRGTRSQRNG